MTMLCCSLSGFSQTSLRVGDTFTIVAPESFIYDKITFVIKQYNWSGLDAAHFSVEYDQSHSFSYKNGGITYYSEGINVAKVTLLQPFQGTMTLNCSVIGWSNGNGWTRNQTYSYTFSCAPVDVTVYPSDITMDVGQSQTLQWQFSPSNTQYGATVSFSSSDKSIADVDLYGKITAKGVGTATITATTNYFTSTTCQVTVNPTLATSISLNKESLTLPVGTTQTLIATVLPTDATDKSVTWTSSNENVATVDAAGKITAVSKGMATITATTNDGTNLSASCAVSVSAVQPTGITLSQEEAEMHVGEQLKLTAAILPTEATQRVTWSSSDPAVARVVGGTVYALDWGECVITAKSVDNSNLTADCLIYVLPEQQANSTDVNGDGKTDVSDVNVVINAILKVN